MRIEYALLGIILSEIGIFLLAKKWNIVSLPNQAGGTIIAFIVAIPFTYIYPLFTSIWTLIFCIAGQVFLTLTLLLSVVFFRFWRDPERTPVENERVIVSSADGKVIYIKKVPQDIVPLATKDGKNYTLHELMGISFDNQKIGVIIIGIEMNIMDVHINRCPIEGEVKLVKHIQGDYFSLRKTEAPFLNTRCTTVISNQFFSVATVQIASRLVRRVDNYLKPRQSVCLGQRLGMIRFGSLVAVIIPDREDLQVEAFIGQIIKAGISVLARY